MVGISVKGLSRETLVLLIVLALQMTVTSAAWAAGFEAGGGTASVGGENIIIGWHASTWPGGTDDIAVGDLPKSGSKQGTDVGHLAQATGLRGAAFGASSYAYGNQSAAIGSAAAAEGHHGAAIGSLAEAMGENSTAVDGSAGEIG